MANTQKKTHKDLVLFGKQLTTPVGRLVFPSIARPTSFKPGQTEKYSAMIVLNDTPETQHIVVAVDELAKQAFGEQQVAKPYISGEEVLAKMEKSNDNLISLYSGRYRLKASANITNQKGEPLPPPNCYLPGSPPALMPRQPGNEQDLLRIAEQFYAGCFVRLAITPYTYVTGINKGVSFILKGVQFIRDGERLGQQSAEEAFMAEPASDGWEENKSFMVDKDSIEDVNI